MKIRAPEPADLSVRVGKEAALQQRVVGEIDPRNHVTGMERGLLRFGKEVDRVAVEHHPPHDFDGNHFLRNDLGRVQNVEVETGRLFLIEGLNAKLPLGKSALGDGFIEIAAMEVRVRAIDLYRLVPDNRGRADGRAPVEFDEGRFAIRVDEPEGVDSEPLHHPERTRDGSIGHDPQDHVHALRQERDEIPERVMRRGVLGIAAVRLHLHRMDEIGKLDRVLDEKDGNVIADEVEIALVGVEFDRKAAHIAGQVPCARAAGHGGEPREHFRFLALLGEERRLRQMRNRIGHLEITVCARSASVNDALWNSLVIEMGDLLAEREIFQERRTARPGFQRILIVGDDDALIGRQGCLSGVSGLMGAPPGPATRYCSGSLSFSKPFVLLVFAIKALRAAHVASDNARRDDLCRFVGLGLAYAR